MFKRFAFLLLCCSFTLRADWNQALLAYEQQDYNTARLHFSELVKVGNANAMFSLAAMYFNGEGQDADKVQAAALFKLAADFGHADATALAAQLGASLQPAEQTNYAQMVQQWQQQVMVPAGPAMLTRPSVATAAQPIRRVEPRYPVDAARRGQSGYVKMHYRVDEQGRVTDITVLDAYPQQLFIKEALKALQSWRYSSGSPQLTVTELSFTLEIPGQARLNIPRLEQALFQSKLWDLAVAGSAEHQLILSQLLRHLVTQGAHHFIIDPVLPLTAPDLNLLQPELTVKADFTTIAQQTLVTVDPSGVITTAEADPALIGKQLSGVKTAGQFLLEPRIVNTKAEVFVQPALTVSRAWSADYWLEQAARNGQIDAQRNLAATDQHWLNYLLAKQDPVAISWQATGLLAQHNH